MERRSRGEAGFSLLELFVCMTIIITLSAIAALQFRDWSTKASIEKQIKMIFMDLVDVRTRALFRKEPLSVRFLPDSYAVFSDTAPDQPPLVNKQLPHRISRSRASDVRYDTLGATDNLQSICIDGEERSSAIVDSLVISRTRTRLGKRDSGKPCNATYIK